MACISTQLIMNYDVQRYDEVYAYKLAIFMSRRRADNGRLDDADDDEERSVPAIRACHPV